MIEINQATVSARSRSKPVPMRLLCGFLLVAGCTASSKEVQPHDDDIFFPTGAALSPDQRFLFVANANSDLTWDSGTIAVIDLDYVDSVAAAWTDNGDSGACTKIDHSETLNCDEPAFMIKTAGVRTGNFATDIAVQDTGNGNARLIVPTRGDPSITWIDWDGQGLSCSPNQGFTLCDEQHRLQYVHNDPDLASIPDEPFDAYADSSGQFAVVSHLTTGAVTLIDSPIGGNAVVADVASGLFAADPLTGLRGATGISARPSAGGNIIYVASRGEDRVQTLSVGRPPNSAPPYLVPGNYFFLNTIGNNSGSSTDSRGMAFSASGDRMYLLNRRPPSLQIYDTSLSATGFPKNMGIGGTDICRQASELTLMDTGDGERAYVTCFQDGELYIIDPRGLSMVEDIVLVGRGPYSVVGSIAHKKVYVTNFLEDTIAVIDVSPTSKFHNRVVLRIGNVRTP